MKSLLIAIVSLYLFACAGTAEQRTRTTLDTVAAVVDPAYDAAMTGCTAVGDAIVAKAKADGFKEAYASDYEANSARCKKTRDAFETIRKLHDEAAKLVDSGKFAEAQAALAQLMGAWRALKGASHVQGD